MRQQFSNIPIAFRLTCALLTFSCSIAGAAAPKSSARIEYYEVAHDVVLEKDERVNIFGRPARTRDKIFSFNAFGRRLIIELTPNDRLLHKLRSKIHISESESTSYLGSIAGNAQSWARMSVIDGTATGVIWDGSEFYIVDQAANLRPLVSGKHAPEDLLVVRGGDLYLPIEPGLSIDTSHQASYGAEATAKTGEALQNKNTAIGTPTRAISLGLVVDGILGENRSITLAILLGKVNIADGIFSNQVDIHLDVEHILSFDRHTDPFTSTDPQTLLSEVAGLKRTNNELAPLGLVHLFTGVNLDGDVLGIAQRSSLCGIGEGAGLTSFGHGFVLDGLIMAHEIGHNFGAPHDAEVGSQCASTPADFLMAPNLNGNSEFSPCSLSQMVPVLATASCLTAVESSELELAVEPLPAQVHVQERIEYSFFVSNIGTESIFDGHFEFSSNDDIETAIEALVNNTRRCSNLHTPSTETCDLGILYGGESVEIPVHIKPRSAGAITLNAFVSASNDIDLSNNESSVVLDVQPATTVWANGGEITDNVIKPGGTVSYVAIASNQGDFDTVSSILLSVGANHRLSTTDDCTQTSQQEIVCQLGTLLARSEKSIQFELTADPTPLALTESSRQLIDVEATSTMYDFQPGANKTVFTFTLYGAFRHFVTGFVTPPESVNIGESNSFVLFVGNEGPDAVVDAMVRVGESEGEISLGTASPQLGSCTPSTSFFDCVIPIIEAGENVEISVPYTGKVIGKSRISFCATSLFGFDPNRSSSCAVTTFEVTDPSPPPPPVAPRSGGGGGALDFATLLLGLIGYMRLRPR